MKMDEMQITRTNPIGRTLDSKECGRWEIGKVEAELSLELFKGFFKNPSFTLLALPVQAASPADSPLKRTYTQSISQFRRGTPCAGIGFATS